MYGMYLVKSPVHEYHRDPSRYDYMVEAMSYKYPETPFVSSLRLKFIQCLTLISSASPEGWAAYRHPEGALYFVHCESVSSESE